MLAEADQTTHLFTLRPCFSSPLSQVTQWLKSQEIAARRRRAHALAAEIWASHPDEDWCRLTRERSAALLRAHAQSKADPGADALSLEPSEWETNEFFNHTLEQRCAWRYAEVQRERKAFFESCLDRVKASLRAESDAYRHGSLAITKNELTRRLTREMGMLPTAAEVDEAWQDRHQIPAIDWVEDAI